MATVTAAGVTLTVTASVPDSPTAGEHTATYTVHHGTRYLGTVTRVRRDGRTAWRYDVSRAIVAPAEQARDAKCDRVATVEFVRNAAGGYRVTADTRASALDALVWGVQALDRIAAQGVTSPDPAATVTVALTVAQARLQLNLNRATLREHPTQGDGREGILAINATLEAIIAATPRATA